MAFGTSRLPAIFEGTLQRLDGHAAVADPIVPDNYHRGEDIHGMADKGYSRMVVEYMNDADKDAMAAAAKGGRQAGRVVILDAVRKLSDYLVDGSADPRAISLERMLRTLERPLPRPDFPDPYDWKGYVR